MKKTIQFLSIALLAVTVFANPLKAQDLKKDLDMFTKKFQDAYNKKDDKALKMMFTTDAVRTDATGAVVTGDENIRAAMVTAWSDGKPVLMIHHDKADKQTDGSVISSGTYTVTGTSGTGEKLDVKGTYTNTVVKDNGKWKISKMVLGN